MADSLSDSQVQSLLQEPGWVLEPELPEGISKVSSTASAGYVNHLNGWVLLVNRDGTGKVYKSTEEWLFTLEDLGLLHYDPGVHYLEGRLPQGERFVSEVPELINQLSEQLDIPREELDLSESSLEKIDRAVLRIGPMECLEAEIFAPLVAYLGEVLRQQVGGRWELRPVPRTEIWEPRIIDASGRRLGFVSSLYDELAEEPEHSISAVVETWS